MRKKRTSNVNQRLRKLESSMKAEETKKHVTPYGEKKIQAKDATVGNGLSLANVVNNMAQGDTGNTVDGLEYALTGIKNKWFIHNQTAVDVIFRIAVVRSKNYTMSVQGEDLFLDFQGQGLAFSNASESQKIYLPLNHRRYDIIFEDMIKVGKSNASNTSQYDNNQFINNYKRFNNRKESIDSSENPNTEYYLVAWVVDANLDDNSCEIELSGHTTFYYKDN